MIRVIKDFANPPPHLEKQKCREKAEEALTQKNTHNFNNKLYGNKEHVRPFLEKIYKDKCAYCETNIKPGAELHIEHYRPKKAARGKPEPGHEGYYWLGYEWSNLLLACHKCNNSKGNKFPIQGIRVFEPSICRMGRFDRIKCNPQAPPLIAERPLLLNPEIDDPGEHLYFNEYAEIEGKTRRSKETIKICGLNRDDLIKMRQHMINNVNNELKRILVRFDKGEF